MLQAQDLLVLFVHFCDTGFYLIKRESIPICGSRILFFFFFFGGGGGGGWGRGLPENNPDIFFCTQLKYFTFYSYRERRSRIRACPHSSERLILGGGVLIYFIHMNSPIALFAKSGSAAILKNLASFKNESPSTKITGSGLTISS